MRALIVLAFLLFTPTSLGKVEKADITVLQGGMVFAAGLALGLVGLMSGIKQGEVSAHGIEGIGSGYDVFGKTMVLAVFPELFAIVAFAATFLISAGI